jgi:hypothetical protein
MPSPLRAPTAGFARALVEAADDIGISLGSRGEDRVEARRIALHALAAIVTRTAVAGRFGPELEERVLAAIGLDGALAGEVPREIADDIAARRLEGFAPSPEAFAVAAEALVRRGATESDGVVFTPPAVARFMAAIGISEILAEPPDEGSPRAEALAALLASGRLPRRLADRLASLRILDPAGGTGAFLLASARILESGLRDRADGGLRARIVSEQLASVERDPESVLFCRLALVLYLLEGEGRRPGVPDLPDLSSTIVHGDSLTDEYRSESPADRLFGTGSPGSRLLPFRQESFDLVLANPPYVRQERIERAAKRAIHDRFSRDTGYGFNRRSDLFVYFFGLLPHVLRPEGRAVVISSNSWLNAGYGLGLRRFLKRHFRIGLIVEPQEERWFGSSAVNTAIVLLERRRARGAGIEASSAGRRSGRDDESVRFAALRAPLESVLHDPEWLAEIIQGTAGRTAAGCEIVEMPSGALSPVSRRGGDEDRTPWGIYLRAPSVFREILRAGGSRIVGLRDAARLRFGLKTGCNGFFYVRDRTGSVEEGVIRDRFGFSRDEILRNDLRVIEPSAPLGRLESRESQGGRREPRELFLVEREYLAPAVVSPREIPGLDVDPDRLARRALRVPPEPDLVRSKRVGAYLERGAKAGIGERPSCASRDPWWSLPDQDSPPIVHSLIAHERPSVFRVPGGILVDANLVCVHPRELRDTAVLLAGLLSSFGLLAREFYLLTNLGEGAIKANPIYLGEMPVPDPSAVDARLRGPIEETLTEIGRRPYRGIGEELASEDRSKLDDLFLRMIGIENERRRWEMRREIAGALRSAVLGRLHRVEHVLGPS